MIVRHIFEISDDSRMRVTTKSVHDKNDDFALRYVRIYPGVNSRAELVTLAPAKFRRITCKTNVFRHLVVLVLLLVVYHE